MTTTPQSGSAPSAHDTVKLGLVRPPIVYMISIAAGVLIRLAIPLPFLPSTLAMPLGATLIAFAIALFSWSFREFRAANTPLPARKPTTVIVRSGPYRFSRNPIYLAFSIFQVGIAIWVDSPWLLVTLVGAMAIIHFIVMPKEESYLEGRFGTQYLDYKTSVRRWL
jgi:protein-S-isoprenylcysteine O-methyltransferase Ste14